MGKTADLTVCPKDDHWHLAQGGQDTKGHCKRGWLFTELCPSTLIEAKGRKRCGRKKCTSNRDNRTLERIVKQNPFKNVGEITKSGRSWSQCFKNHYAQTYARHGFSCRIPCVKPLLNNRQRQKRLAWAKDKKDWNAAEWSKVMFLMKVNFAFPLEIRVPESGGREERHRTTLLEVQCKVSTVSDGLGCHVICWCWSLCFLRSKVNTAVYQEVLEHFICFLLLTNFMEMQISFSNRTWHLHTVPKLPVPGLRTMVSLFLIGQQTRLTWRSEDAICQTQQCRRAEGHYQSNLGSHNTWAVPQTDRLHATPHCCSNSGKRSPQLSIECCTCSYFSCSYFSVCQDSKNPFFVLVLSNIQIFWDTEFGVFISCQL